LDGDGASGALSAFGTRNPLYFAPGQTGLGLQGNYGALQFSAGYLAGDANDPNPGAGLFNGSYTALAQVGYVPGENFGIALSYFHGYNQLDTGTGSQRRISDFSPKNYSGRLSRPLIIVWVYNLLGELSMVLSSVVGVVTQKRELLAP
jgi:hypothetical protein